MLEHACFEFGQREMQKELDKRGWTCAEAVPLQTWTVLFRQNETFETEENAFTLSYILNSVDNVQGLTIYRRVVDLDELRELLSHVEEFVQLLNTPAYWTAVKHLRQVIEDTLRRVNITATLFQKGADRKIAQIEEQRKRLKRQEDEVKQGLQESLNKLQNSIECEVFVAMRQAKEDLPDIGLA
jgi:DNA-binding transcriptional MerR regulator